MRFWIGLVAGLATMFILDPRQGRRRRAFVYDKSVHYRKQGVRLIGRKARDIRNRAYGRLAHGRSVIRRSLSPKAA